jgi:hypothetical protein
VRYAGGSAGETRGGLGPIVAKWQSRDKDSENECHSAMPKKPKKEEYFPNPNTDCPYKNDTFSDSDAQLSVKDHESLRDDSDLHQRCRRA